MRGYSNVNYPPANMQINLDEKVWLVIALRGEKQGKPT